MYFLTIVLSSLSIILSNHASESYLELFPDKGKEKVVLPFPYYSPTPEEKKLMKYVGEGCYAKLNKGEIAFVGPLQPCQLVAISNKREAIAAHKKHNTDFPLLLKKDVKEMLGDCDPSDIRAVCYTYDMKERYEEIHRNYYKGKSQKEVLQETKNAIIQEFGIKNRDQVKARFFTSDKLDFALGDYDFAELNVTVKMDQSGEIVVNNMCPMAENIFGDWQHLPLRQRVDVVHKTMVYEMPSKNPFAIQEMKDIRNGNTRIIYPFQKI